MATHHSHCYVQFELEMQCFFYCGPQQALSQCSESIYMLQYVFVCVCLCVSVCVYSLAQHQCRVLRGSNCGSLSSARRPLLLWLLGNPACFCREGFILPRNEEKIGASCMKCGCSCQHEMLAQASARWWLESRDPSVSLIEMNQFHPLTRSLKYLFSNMWLRRKTKIIIKSLCGNASV